MIQRVGPSRAEVLIDRIEGYGHPAIVMREFDEAMIGLSSDFRAVYDADKILDILMKRDGMSGEDAMEWVSYNIEPVCSVDGGFILVWGP